MTSTRFFNNSKSDELFVLGIDDKIMDDKSPIFRDNDQKQSSIPMSQLVDSYSFRKKHKRKMSKLIMEKFDPNVNVPPIATSIITY